MRKYLLGFAVGILLPPVVIAALAVLGLLPVNADSPPPSWETAFARMAFNASVARQAPHLQNPIAPTEENLMAGVKLFKGDCAGCHGDPNTAAANEVKPMLYPNPPQFALHHPTKSDYQMFWIAQHGVRYAGMFIFGGAWKNPTTGQDPSDQKIWTAVTFLSHLDSLPPDVDAEWHKKN
jgi:hypothetical protein